MRSIKFKSYLKLKRIQFRLVFGIRTHVKCRKTNCDIFKSVNQDLSRISPAVVHLAALTQPTTYSPPTTTTTVISATPPRQYSSSRPHLRQSGILDSVPSPGGYTGRGISGIGLSSIIILLNHRIIYLKGS